jgi:spore germination protein GerM
MEDKKNSQGLVATVVVAAVAVSAASGLGWWSFSNRVKSPPPVTVEGTQNNPAVGQLPSEGTPRIYRLQATTKGVNLVPSQVTVAANETPIKALEKALKTLLESQLQDTLTSTIPPGTRLLGLEGIPGNSISKVRIDLSKEFTTGGGSTSMTGRLGQILYTATSIDPNTQVWIEVEGQPLLTLGGEGVEVEQPLTRASFERDFSFIRPRE